MDRCWSPWAPSETVAGTVRMCLCRPRQLAYMFIETWFPQSMSSSSAVPPFAVVTLAATFSQCSSLLSISFCSQFVSNTNNFEIWPQRTLFIWSLDASWSLSSSHCLHYSTFKSFRLPSLSPSHSSTAAGSLRPFAAIIVLYVFHLLSVFWEGSLKCALWSTLLLWLIRSVSKPKVKDEGPMQVTLAN